ncbi:MAG: response regulator [Sphingobium sp.]|nr:response regulator [Sphingobium sp.]MBP6111244.1 response regulator [Sphingobium sp.]MBP8670280.1 response regulator [Sphingobium sp.]MCC6482387.1 response regulator [Sphingomonadaceae bacterium]
MIATSPARSPASAPALTVKVMMVDDSLVTRTAIGRIFDGAADIELVCQAGSLDEAFAYLSAQRTDIILLDHEMPGRKGLDALPHMLDAARDAHVIMLSSYCQRGSSTAVTALSLGASDALAKPTSGEETHDFAEQLLWRVRRLAAARQSRRAEEAPVTLRLVPPDFAVECIGIGASTGGIHALAGLLQAMPPRPDVPILVTQHLPSSFIPYYARQVARMCTLPVSIAREGQALCPNHIYIAPGEVSLSCLREGGTARISLIERRDPLTSARPSVNHMFAGMAHCFGAGAMGVVLTGIGRDGTAGGRAIASAGGVLIAQDQASSTVWGMPGSLAREGLASACLAPADIPRYMATYCGVAV